MMFVATRGEMEHLKREAIRVLPKYQHINPREIFDDPDPLLIQCMRMLVSEGFDLATACKASVALKKEFS
jgi:hypothetical protein